MMEAAVGNESIVLSKLLVSGMDCPDCAEKVVKTVKSMPGVINATLTFPTGKMNVEYDPRQLDVSQVIDKVGALGYKAKEDVNPLKARTTVFYVTGLDCADCAAKLEQQISMAPGVETVCVNFGASKVSVTHTGPVEKILTIIKNLGYSGTADANRPQRNEAGSFWATNQYIKPTAISLIMLVLALAAGHLFHLPEMLVQGLFLAGILLGGYLPAKNGISVLIHAREFDINLLMMIAVIGAAAIGELEEAAAVVFLFSLGNALQGYTLDKTRNSIQALMELTPNEALVRRGTVERTLPVEEIMACDIIIVRPGERIAMDGIIGLGSSTVNQAPITGESMPVEKQPGDEVYAGTINERGALEVEVTKLARDNTISRIISLVEEAQGQRAPSQQFIDKFAKYYTPMVMLLAAMVAVLPTLAAGQPFEKWFYEAMALLLVACPCALVISTPVSIVSAIGNAAKNGVLIKGGMYLEEAGALSVIALDKTGTLTEGRPRVTDVIPLNGLSEQELLNIAAAIESRSEHALAQAVVGYALEREIEIIGASDFEAVTGKGARAVVQDSLYQIGNLRFFIEQAIGVNQVEEDVYRLQNEGKTVTLVGDKTGVLGIIAVADVLRENAGRAVAGLKKSGIKKVVMLTGDNERTAQAVAEQAGVDDFRADLLPEEKVEAIKDLLAEHGKVAMVGDGVNDAPAMAISTVGIAMGAIGTDTALETADIALMNDDLTKLSYVTYLSRKALGIIKQNITLALIIKGLILLLVIPGWLTLWLAVVADMGSSLLVTLNSMRLLRVSHEQV